MNTDFSQILPISRCLLPALYKLLLNSRSLVDYELDSECHIHINYLEAILLIISFVLGKFDFASDRLFHRFFQQLKNVFILMLMTSQSGNEFQFENSPQ